MVEAAFQLLFERSSLPILIYDSRDFSFLAVNKAAENRYGYSKKDFRRITLHQLRLAEQTSSCEALIKKIKKNRPRPVTLKVRHRTQNGNDILVKVEHHSIIYKKRDAILAIIVDLTEQQLTQHALESTEERLNAFMTHNPAATWIKDENFRYVYINPMFEETFGLSCAKVKGKTDFEIWPEAIAKQFRENDVAVLSKQKPVRTQETAPGLDASILHWNVYKFPYADSHSRRFIGGVGFNITEHRNAAEKIKLQASLLDQVRNAVIMTDQQGRIIYWNRFAESLYQWKAKEVLGKSVLDCTVPEESKALAAGIMHRLKSEGHFEGEFIVCRKDGSKFPAFVTDTVVKDEDGNILGIIGISVDVSEYKAARKELEEKNIALKEILAQLELEKKAIKDMVAENIDKLIFPVLKKIKNKSSEPERIEKYVDLLEQYLKDFAGREISQFNLKFKHLSGKEIEICNLIRSGLSNKEIAKLLSISCATVETHRVRIRKKLKLRDNKVNLASYLQTL